MANLRRKCACCCSRPSKRRVCNEELTQAGRSAMPHFLRTTLLLGLATSCPTSCPRQEPGGGGRSWALCWLAHRAWDATGSSHLLLTRTWALACLQPASLLLLASGQATQSVKARRVSGKDALAAAAASSPAAQFRQAQLNCSRAQLHSCSAALESQAMPAVDKLRLEEALQDSPQVPGQGGMAQAALASKLRVRNVLPSCSGRGGEPSRLGKDSKPAERSFVDRFYGWVRAKTYGLRTGPVPNVWVNSFRLRRVF